MGSISECSELIINFVDRETPKQIINVAALISKPALFNLAKDSDEKENLHLRTSSRTHVKALRRLLENWWQPGNDTAVPKPPEN